MTKQRYVIVGAGAVGGAIGGALALVGHPVVLLARGAHLEALRARGLTLVTPGGPHRIVVSVASSASDVPLDVSDVVIVATKTQDTEAALAPIRDRRVPILCAQNGIANERIAHARFDDVYGMVVFAPLAHLEPGIVSIHAAPSFGGIDLGRDPSGEDARADAIVADLVAAGFDARVRGDIARWKVGKLLSNLGNALEALGGRAALRPEWLGALSDEAEACLRAAGIDHVGVGAIFERFAGVREVGARGGGSTWQSLARGQPLETEHLNGEVVRLGAQYGVATPMNAALVALAARASAERWAPGVRSIAELSAALSLPARAPSRAPT